MPSAAQHCHDHLWHGATSSPPAAVLVCAKGGREKWGVRGTTGTTGAWFRSPGLRQGSSALRPSMLHAVAVVPSHPDI